MRSQATPQARYNSRNVYDQSPQILKSALLLFNHDFTPLQSLAVDDTIENSNRVQQRLIRMPVPDYLNTHWSAVVQLWAGI